MVNQLISIVEDELNIENGSILSRSIKYKMCIGRYICYRYLHEEHQWSANRISRKFGRSRKNVFRGIMVLKNLMEYNVQLRQIYLQILEKVEGVFNTPSTDIMEE